MEGGAALNVEILRKYSHPAPYYTSYPVLGRWTDKFNNISYRNALTEFSKKGNDDPVSLYAHFPFCEKMCYYCICNFVVTHDRQRIKDFLGYLFKEIDMLADFFDQYSFRPRITDIHLGGGTPSYMENEEVDLLLKKIERLLRPGALDELTIEIDIRQASRKNIEHYAKIGITRLSFGIQDFNPLVQKTINREQTPEKFEEVFPREMRKEFRSFNFDLLYGLPHQTRETFRETIDQVIEIGPSRITLLKYAHVPHLRKHMKLLKESDMPDEIKNKIIFNDSIQQLKKAGYVYVGIDHFAKSTDSLAMADQSKTVGRSFLGFNPGKFQHLLGVGPSSTAAFLDYYSQNISDIPQYCAAIKAGDFAIERGYALSADDCLRREIINCILCDYAVDLRATSSKYNVEPFSYFQNEIESFGELIQDGIMTYEDGKIKVTTLGRIYIQHICKRFDSIFGKEQYVMSGPTIKSENTHARI